MVYRIIVIVSCVSRKFPVLNNMASLQVKFPTSLSKCTTLCHLVACDQHPLPDVLSGEDRATGFDQQ